MQMTHTSDMFSVHEFDTHINDRFEDILRSTIQETNALPSTAALFVGIVVGVVISRVACICAAVSN